MKSISAEYHTNSADNTNRKCQP